MIPVVLDDALPPAALTTITSVSMELPNRSRSAWLDASIGDSPLLAIFALLQAMVEKYAGATDLCGAEWWARRSPGYHFQGWHVDKDEVLFRRSGRVKCPSIASVLYLGNPGGPTLISSQVSTADGSALIPAELERAWLVPPKLNRLVMFSGDAAHAVLPDAGCVDVRSTVPINWWSTPIEIDDVLSYRWSGSGLGNPIGGQPEPMISSAVPVSAIQLAAGDFPRTIRQSWPPRRD